MALHKHPFWHLKQHLSESHIRDIPVLRHKMQSCSSRYRFQITDILAFQLIIDPVFFHNDHRWFLPALFFQHLLNNLFHLLPVKWLHNVLVTVQLPVSLHFHIANGSHHHDRGKSIFKPLPYLSCEQNSTDILPVLAA